MSYSAKAIANLLIDHAKNLGEEIDQMKLQKLVYISHGWSLALFDEELINEPVQAWRHGPVIPTLYHEFKHCGRKPISDHAVDIDFDMDSLDFIEITPEVSGTDNRTKTLIERIWKKYGDLTGPQLSNLTHMEGTPWSEKYSPERNGIMIDNKTIKKHFKRLAKKDD